MSTPALYGWVEVRDGEGSRWQGIVDVADLLAQCPDGPLYESLFWPGFAELGFKTIAPERGVPVDASGAVRADLSAARYGDAYKHTWITWREIRDMDWDQLSALPDQDHLPHVYSRTADGRLVHEGVGAGGYAEWWQGKPEIFEDNGKILRYEHISRRKAFEQSMGWPSILTMLRALAQRYGADNVRVVVRFDVGWPQYYGLE